MKKQNKIYDCLIIGAGPAGLSAAIYLKRANVDVAVLEMGPIGGKTNYISIVNNYLGLNNSFGPDLAMKFYEHAQANKIEFIADEVTTVTKSKDLFVIISQDDETYYAKSVIVASGSLEKKLDLPKADIFEHKGISYCAICDGPLYKNKDVAVIGGGGSALEEALYLSRIVNKVYLIHRRDEFRADEGIVNEVKKQKNIEILYSSLVTTLFGENKLEAIEINGKNRIDVSALFPYIGLIPNTNFLKFDNLCNKDGYILINNNGETIVEGLFAAGDVANGPMKQIVTASADGAIASKRVLNYLQNKK